MRDKSTSARLCAKNAGGGLMREGGAYLRDTTVIEICTPRNLFPMIRASEICKKRLKHQKTGRIFSK